MNLPPDEKAKLEAEWASAQRFGAALARRKAFATAVSCAVLLPFFLLGFLSIRLFALMLFVGFPAAWWVRTKLWPKGQFQ